MINIIVTREFINKTSDGNTEVEFIDENIRKKGIIRPQGCAGLSIYNAAESVVYINNIPLNGLQTKNFRSMVPDCILKTEFRINDSIIGSQTDIAVPAPPSTL